MKNSFFFRCVLLFCALLCLWLTPAHGQTLLLRFALADSGPGTACPSDTNGGGANAILSMFDQNYAPADKHGAANSGVGGVSPAMDFTGQPDGNTSASVDGPVARDTNDAALGFGAVSNWTATLWFNQDPGNSPSGAPYLFLLGSNGFAREPASNLVALRVGGGNSAARGYLEVYPNNMGEQDFQITSPQDTPFLGWQFVAVTYNETSRTLTVYGGTADQPVTRAVTGPATLGSSAAIDFGTSGSLYLGNRDNRQRVYSAWFQDFRFYSGVASQAFLEEIRQGILPPEGSTPPSITQQPASQTADAGQAAPVLLSVRAAGSPPLSYQWQAGAVGTGVFANLSDDGQMSGATSANLTLSDVGVSNTADFRVIVTNANGSVTSRVATLAVFPPWQDSGYQHAPASTVESWKDLKYGLRIHWGLYSMDPSAGWDASWKLYGYVNDPAGYQRYQNWYQTFNPTNYDPNAWMDMMTNGGMTFFTFTTKHHEGFCMYDTSYTVTNYATIDLSGAPVIKSCPTNFHYSIMETPYGRDVLAMLIRSARGRPLPYAQGIPSFRVGLYYTDIDWYDADFRFGGSHPLYPGGIDSSYTYASDPAGYQRARNRYVGEVAEICRLLPPNELLSICFDMGFPGTPECENMIHDMVMNARALQPNCLFRNRCIGDYYGDYYTPEGTTADNGGNWMVIYPLGYYFGYDPDGSHYKGPAWIIMNLVDIVARGGIFQIGLGPGPDGTFHPTAVSQVRAAGQWLAANHECIYSTRPAAVSGETWNGQDIIRYSRTKDPTNTFIMCTGWPGDTLTLTQVSAASNSVVTMLADPMQRVIPWSQDANGLHLSGLSPLQSYDVGCHVWVFKVQEMPTVTTNIHLSVECSNATLTLSWPLAANNLGLYCTTNLAPPIVWAQVTNRPVAANGVWTVTTGVATNSRFYYRLQSN